MNELIKRLRHIARLDCDQYGATPEDAAEWKAADLIEQQAGEIADISHVSQLHYDQNLSLRQEVAALRTVAAEMAEALESIKKDDSHNPTLMVMITDEALGKWKELNKCS